MTWVTTAVDRSHSVDHLKWLIAEGMQGSSAAYSHQQLINWCVEFSQAFYDAKLSANQCKALSALADDISVQWELYIASVYSLEQMARIDLNDLILPKQQFQHWQTLLETLLNEFETP